jgi:hypothetical protein
MTDEFTCPGCDELIKYVEEDCGNECAGCRKCIVLSEEDIFCTDCAVSGVVLLGLYLL